MKQAFLLSVLVLTIIQIAIESLINDGEIFSLYGLEQGIYRMIFVIAIGGFLGSIIKKGKNYNWKVALISVLVIWGLLFLGVLTRLGEAI